MCICWQMNCVNIRMHGAMIKRNSNLLCEITEYSCYTNVIHSLQCLINDFAFFCASRWSFLKHSHKGNMKVDTQVTNLILLVYQELGDV